MDRKPRVVKKDRTGAYISVAVHVLVFGIIAYIILTQTKLGQLIREYTIGAERVKKSVPTTAPIQPAARRGPRPVRSDAPPVASGGGRRQTDAPPPVDTGFVVDERSETKIRKESGPMTRTNVQQQVTAPPPAKLVLRPSAFSALKTDIKQLLAERAKSSALVESFGTEQISKSGASDVSDIVGRISGASLAEGKFAVVRGLSDRYTLTTLNGADIPSADPNRRAVQLDLFPAQFISKVDVSKTFQPDLPGGFAGGAINIVTRSFPDRPLLSLSVGTSYNTQANLRDDYLRTDHGGTDWLAMDDGKRELPAIAAATNPEGSNLPLGEPIKDSFSSRQFAPVEGSSPLNSSFSVAFGDTTHLFGRKLGFVAGVNYKSDYSFYDDGMTARYSAVHPTNTVGVNQSYTKSDARAVMEYTWGSIVTLAYEPFPHHELGFNFMYVQTAEDEARRIRGRDASLTSPDSDLDLNYVEQDVLHWTERNLTYFQLQGKHEFPDLFDLRMDWVGSLGSTSQDEPDYRIFSFYAQPGDPNDPTDDDYLANGPTKPSQPTRLFRELNEDNRNIRADWTLPVLSYNSGDNSVKAGVAISKSEQTLFARAFTVTPAGNHPFRQTGDINAYLSRGNNPYVTYFNFSANFEYTGQQTISAWYGMGTWSATDWLRLVGGVRAESTDISVDTHNVTQGDTPTAFSSGAIEQKDLLPAVGATFALRTNLQLRLAWSQTVVRPTYREISDAENYDIGLGRTISGNPTLKMSAIENYDVRLEWYPRAGELISVGGFMKKITLPIEQAAETRDNENIFYSNYDKADVFGFEIELRKNFPGLLGRGIDQFSLGFNYAYIKSIVDLTKEQRDNRAGYGDTSTDRPLYDQPEYVLNGDLTWDHLFWGTSITVNGGVTGRRLVLVGLATPDEFEEPAPYLDLSISQRLGRRLRAKFSAKNLLNPTYEVTQTWPSIGTVPIKGYRKGMSFGISLSYDF
jgi:TonB-dependent receptor